MYPDRDLRKEMKTNDVSVETKARVAKIKCEPDLLQQEDDCTVCLNTI